MSQFHFNINNKISVKLTDHGKDILINYLQNIYSLEHAYSTINIHTDKNGFYVDQLHRIINIFAESLYVGSIPVFQDNVIIFSSEDLDLI